MFSSSSDFKLDFTLTKLSRERFEALERQVGDVNVPLKKFAFKLYQDAEREGYMPELTGDLKHNKVISEIGKNVIRITQLVPYAEIRYSTNKKHPNQTEWFDKYFEQHSQQLKSFLTREITKELEDILGESI